MFDEHTNSYNSPFKYNGKEFDAETGNYFYSARYYDPKWSIFISVDPLAEQTFEPYSYVGNNPIRYIDPTGMSKDDVININVDTGTISIKTQEGDHVVQFVDDNGKILDSYTYGENKSFKKDIKHTETSKINELATYNNDNKADFLFDKISKNSNIEWEFITLNQGKNTLSLLGNCGRLIDDGQGVNYSSEYFIPQARFMRLFGWRINKHEHNHPLYYDGSIADWPSGYDKSTKLINPNSQNGDANFARMMRFNSYYKKFSSPDIKFYIRVQGANYKVEYNGIDPYKHIKK